MAKNIIAKWIETHRDGNVISKTMVLYSLHLIEYILLLPVL